MDRASFPVAAKDMAAIRGNQVGVPYLPSLPTTDEKTLDYFRKVMKEAGLI
jgi:4-hydroxy-tetrahydrodipicolinate synthase